MIGKGNVFKANVEPYHRWVVLNDPAAHGGKVLLISLTSLKSNTRDRSCILGPSDYPDLDHATVVAYAGRKTGSATAFDNAVASGAFRVLPDMPTAALQKIIAAARISDFLSDSEKRLLE